MEKTKAKTLAERFGFKDSELSTPAHDDIFCWLFDKENALQMLLELGLLERQDATRIHRPLIENNGYYGCDWSWVSWTCSGHCNYNGYKACSNCYNSSEDELAYSISKNIQFYKENIEGLFSAKDLIKVSGEMPILNGKYTIGFVDATVKVKPEYYLERGACFFGQVFFNFNQSQKIFYVEIKPSIPSLGELLRQINLYRSYVDDGIWIILTDNAKDEFVKILKTQNIYVYSRKTGYDNQVRKKSTIDTFLKNGEGA